MKQYPDTPPEKFGRFSEAGVLAAEQQTAAKFAPIEVEYSNLGMVLAMIVRVSRAGVLASFFRKEYSPH